VNLSLYENASALRGLEQQQNVIANNIAASHVAGFKKIAVSFEAVEGGEIARSTHDRLRNEMPGSFPVMKNQIDFNEGEMKQTSNPMDLALRGDGFFCIAQPKW
jgi:flagellar basal body rod protein FlgG